ncbi:MAG TPA: hypothetical protein VGH42_13515 [Verrucomicrobiae bacterium]|jgi:hypothetical protein
MNSDNFTKDMRVRVPEKIKMAFEKLEKKTFKKQAELAREAFVQYLRKNGFKF